MNLQFSFAANKRYKEWKSTGSNQLDAAIRRRREISTLHQKDESCI